MHFFARFAFYSLRLGLRPLNQFLKTFLLKQGLNTNIARPFVTLGNFNQEMNHKVTTWFDEAQANKMQEISKQKAFEDGVEFFTEVVLLYGGLTYLMYRKIKLKLREGKEQKRYIT